MLSTVKHGQCTNLVKISFVTTQTPWESLKCLQRAKTSAVFPDPTGPPIPTVKARQRGTERRFTAAPIMKIENGALIKCRSYKIFIQSCNLISLNEMSLAIMFMLQMFHSLMFTFVESFRGLRFVHMAKSFRQRSTRAGWSYCCV